MWYILENKCMDNENMKRFGPEKDRERFPERVMLEVTQEMRMRENEEKMLSMLMTTQGTQITVKVIL